MKHYIYLLLLAGLVAAPAAFSQDSLSATTLKEYPVLWQQKAAEYRALCYQAFNMATWQVNQLSKRDLRKSRPAIITDLDETILDNSYYEAQLIREQQHYSSSTWKQWTSLSAATAVPGAVAFLQYAAAKGITIFYVSNRDTSELAATLANLRQLQLPDADTAHCLFRSNTSSKETRRQSIMTNYNVIMLLGDNLDDFTALFENKGTGQRSTQADQVKADWGRKFIVLPNATYGTWENALYNYEHTLTAAQQEAIRQALLTGYKKP